MIQGTTAVNAVISVTEAVLIYCIISKTHCYFPTKSAEQSVKILNHQMVSPSANKLPQRILLCFLTLSSLTTVPSLLLHLRYLEVPCWRLLFFCVCVCSLSFPPMFLPSFPELRLSLQFFLFCFFGCLSYFCYLFEFSSLFVFACLLGVFCCILLNWWSLTWSQTSVQCRCLESYGILPSSSQ